MVETRGDETRVRYTRGMFEICFGIRTGNFARELKRSMKSKQQLSEKSGHGEYR